MFRKIARKIIRKIILFGVAVVLPVLMASAAGLAANPITIKFSHAAAENTPKGKMAIKFKELVAERLGGRVQVEVFPDSQLFGDNNEIEAMLHGDVQLIAPALAKFERYTQQLRIFDLPFLFRDMAAVEKFQRSAKGQALLNSMESQGVAGLGYLHDGLKQLSCTSPIKVPVDASGLKFRIMASDVLAAQFQAVHAVPLKKPFSEVFTLLRTKEIDGQESTYSTIYSNNFFEFQSHITESNHGVLDYMLVTSIQFWMSLPEDIRKDVKKALDEAIFYGNEIAAARDLANKQMIVASQHTKIITLSGAERNQWIEVMNPVWLRFEDEIGRELIDAAYQANM